MGKSFVLSVAGAVVVPVLALVAAPAGAAPTTACAGAVTGDQVRFTWSGDAGNGVWKDAGNWDVADAGGALPDRAPNYFGDPGTDDSLDGLVCVAPATATTITLDDETHVHVAALEVANATLVANLARVMVYADPVDHESVIHDDASLTLRAATLGGPGSLRVDGEVVWGQTGFGASTLDQDFCDGFPSGEAVEACPTTRPGRLLVGDGGLLRVAGRGVNLSDGYRVDVAAGGTLRIQGAGYVAADRDTVIDVGTDGLLDLAGDGNVFEGFANGQPDPDLAELVNDGTVRKSAGDGRSSLNVDYSGTGDVDVQEGGLSIAGGAPVEATVAARGRLGTGRCLLPAGQRPPTQVCTPTTDGTDPQFAVLSPDRRTSGLAITEGTTTAPGGDVQPAVRVAADDATRAVPATLSFQFDDAIPGRPSRLRSTVFQRRPGLAPRWLPLCRPGGTLPRGATACVVGRRDAGGALRLTVRTTKPRGFWSLRPSGVDFVNLRYPLVGSLPRCQVTHPRYPFLTREPVVLQEAGSYVLRFATAENRADGGARMGAVRHGTRGRNEPLLRIARTGWVAALKDGESTGAFRVVATPTVRFTDRTRHTFAGRRMIVRGQVTPGRRFTVRLLQVRMGARRVAPLAGTATRVPTDARGRFRMPFTPPRQGRYVLAVQVLAGHGLSAAVSRQSVKVYAKPRPRRLPSDTDDYSPVVTTPTDGTGRATDPLDVLDGFYPGRAGTCRFYVRY